MSKPQKNLNLVFYKLYYSCLGKDAAEIQAHFSQMNEILMQAKFSHEKDYVHPPVEDCQRILLKTVYPGLLIGVGNPHSTNSAIEEINIGFSFDYVSGQPFVPASSVKGVLRSYFKKYPEDVMALAGLSEIDAVKSLEKEIFEGDDVFLDAVVYAGDRYGRLLGFDYLAPHRSPIEAPIPISFIKMLPDVRLEFRFILQDGALLTAEQKRALFMTLLTLFGIGAKTNTGYGFLEEASSEIEPSQEEKETVVVNPERVCRTCQKPFILAPGQLNYIAQKGHDPFKDCPQCFKKKP